MSNKERELGMKGSYFIVSHQYGFEWVVNELGIIKEYGMKGVSRNNISYFVNESQTFHIEEIHIKRSLLVHNPDICFTLRVAGREDYNYHWDFYPLETISWIGIPVNAIIDSFVCFRFVISGLSDLSTKCEFILKGKRTEKI